MSNPSGRTGAEWETRCVEYLKANGFPYAERRAKNGRFDRGDIAGIPGVVLECKAEKRIDLAGYMKETAAEKANARAEIGAAVIKRRHHGVDKAYVVMELSEWIKLIT